MALVVVGCDRVQPFLFLSSLDRPILRKEWWEARKRGGGGRGATKIDDNFNVGEREREEGRVLGGGRGNEDGGVSSRKNNGKRRESEVLNFFSLARVV